MSKFFLKSKTVIGALIAGLPAVLGAFGVTVPELGGLGDTLVTWLDASNEIVGMAIAIYGRFQATDAVTLMPDGR